MPSYSSDPLFEEISSVKLGNVVPTPVEAGAAAAAEVIDEADSAGDVMPSLTIGGEVFESSSLMWSVAVAAMAAAAAAEISVVGCIGCCSVYSSCSSSESSIKSYF